MKKPKTRFTKKEIATFKKKLIERKQQLLKLVDKLGDEALRRGRQDSVGDLSNFPQHVAEMGTDTFSQDISLGLMQSEQRELREINIALEKIEAGTFGICESCQNLIPKQRLNVLPSAKFCVECQEKKEKEEELSA
jgi:RNA polymerase-binding transcription factor DksA